MDRYHEQTCSMVSFWKETLCCCERLVSLPLHHQPSHEWESPAAPLQRALHPSPNLEPPCSPRETTDKRKKISNVEKKQPEARQYQLGRIKLTKIEDDVLGGREKGTKSSLWRKSRENQTEPWKLSNQTQRSLHGLASFSPMIKATAGENANQAKIRIISLKATNIKEKQRTAFEEDITAQWRRIQWKKRADHLHCGDQNSCDSDEHPHVGVKSVGKFKL